MSTIVRQAVFAGIDISKYVNSWASVEQVKDVLLVRATFMTSEMNLECYSGTGLALMLKGMNWYNAPLLIYVDSVLVYEGLTRNININDTERTATFITENVLKGPAESLIAYTGTGLNPASAMLSIARQVVAVQYIDTNSFALAGGPSSQAGATVNVAFAQGGNTTALQALQQIGDLASIAVYVVGNRIVAKPFRAYRGNLAGLRFTIRDGNIREWGTAGYDASSFNNRVSVGYGSQYVSLDDVRSQRKNKVIRDIQFPNTGPVVASNRQSAAFYGSLYLKRAAMRKRLIPVAGGVELKMVAIGDQHPVTNARQGLTQYPVEVIEVHRNLDTSETELLLATLPPEDAVC